MTQVCRCHGDAGAASEQLSTDSGDVSSAAGAATSKLHSSTLSASQDDFLTQQSFDRTNISFNGSFGSPLGTREVTRYLSVLVRSFVVQL